MADIKETPNINVTTKYKTKEKSTLPKGAIVESKEVSVEVEEIENGFLITKKTEYKYRMKDKDYSDWKTCYKKYYNKTNPVEIETANKALADMFEETDSKSDY